MKVLMMILTLGLCVALDAALAGAGAFWAGLVALAMLAGIGAVIAWAARHRLIG